MSHFRGGKYRHSILFCLSLFCLLWVIGCHRESAKTPAKMPSSQFSALPFKLTFADVTKTANIDFQQTNGATGKRYFLETTGSGACWFDYDNDGWMDIYVVQNGPLPGSASFGPGGNRLYHNQKGVFKDVTKIAGVAGRGYGQGCAAADVDNDGFTDLLVTGFGQTIFYRNNGNGTFADVTASSGLNKSPGWSSSAAFADYDNDGFLDLYVGHYCAYKVGQDPPCTLAPKLRGYCPPNQFQGESGRLFHNEGHGNFRDVTQSAGMLNADGKNLGVVWGDFNNDGKIDLFVANDNRRNLLFQNNGDGTFEETALRAGVALAEDGRTMAGMGTDMADCDNDGQLDIAVANFADEPNALWKNTGKGLFDDVTFSSQVGPPSLPLLGFGLTFFDVDFDGFKDLMVANGHIQDQIGKVRQDATFAQPALLYHNKGNGTFEDSSRAAGRDFVKPRSGRGLCVGDYDNDGDLDVFMVNLNGPATLLRNDGGNKNQHLVIRCLSKNKTRDAIGARVTVEATGLNQVAEVRSASGYLSQNDPRLFFGLGRTVRVERVEVRWPDGSKTERQNVAANQLLTLVEGQP